MFDWLGMIGNYEQRKVANDETDLFVIDTALVTDREKKYETAICHKHFNDREWIILEWADTKEEALEIHRKWLEHFSNNDVNEITDCYEGITYKKESEEK